MKSRTRLRDFTFTFHFHALEKEMATHSSVLAWRIPGTGEPGGLPCLGSHRVGHDWSNLAAAAARHQEEKTGAESLYAWWKGHVGRHQGSGTSESWFSVTFPPRSWLVTLRSELPRHWWTGPSLETYHYEHHWLHPESCPQTGERTYLRAFHEYPSPN